MSMSETRAPAGWYPDPHDPMRGRYWNGVEWTDLTHVPGQPIPATPQLKAPPGTNVTTPWIWLIVFLPLVPYVLLLFVPWGSTFDIDPTAPDAYTGMGGALSVWASPLLWISTGLSYLIYGLSVFFASLDMKQLSARGVPKPFHWAWAFLGGIVYAIGRSIVAAWRTGKGYGPIWAEIGVVVVSFVVTGVILAGMFSGMAEFLNTVSEYR